MAKLIRSGKVAACHDVSDGGIAVAAAEMCIASGLGLIVGQPIFGNDAVFAEIPGRYLVELADGLQSDSIKNEFNGVANVIDFGITQHLRKFTVTNEQQRVLEIGLDELTAAWRGTLDW
jgi:phosphoribosylformylglycinamidine synthase